MAKKAVAKKPAKPRKKPRLVEQPHGGALLRGPNDGNGGGRPPDEFKAKMREIASSDTVLAYLEACVKGEHGPKAAISAHKHITERGYGKEPSPVELGGRVKVEIEVVREAG